MVRPHVLLITYPAQGHLNPTLYFAEQLMGMGVEVTFTTTVYGHDKVGKTAGFPKGLSFVSFSDGHDDGHKFAVDPAQRLSDLGRTGSEKLKETIARCSEEGRPVSCVVYTLLLSWAAEAARQLHVPSALLWIQPATVLAVYYHYFNGYGDAIGSSCNDPSWSIKLPNLPLLKGADLPSFLISPASTLVSAPLLQAFREHFEALEREPDPTVLVNSFEELEGEALVSVKPIDVIPVGPLVRHLLVDRGSRPRTDGCKYLDWLDEQREKSVVYVSFGTLIVLGRPQAEEVASGLLATGRPFLWVAKENEDEKEAEKPTARYADELRERGLMLPWCSQTDVLSHPSLGCFVTHCGWNSTLESIVSGVPVVAFPRWSDQGTNAKLIEDVWKTGIRVKANADGIVEGEEIRRCIEIVTEHGGELRRNAEKWKDLGMESVRAGGSSHRNLKLFVEAVASRPT